MGLNESEIYFKIYLNETFLGKSNLLLLADQTFSSLLHKT